MSVPVAIMSLYRQVIVASEIRFVIIIPFLISVSLHLKFSTVERLKNHRVPTVVKVVRTINNIYALQGFNLASINMDPEFEPLRADLDASNILMNVCADN